MAQDRLGSKTGLSCWNDENMRMFLLEENPMPEPGFMGFADEQDNLFPCLSRVPGRDKRILSPSM